MARAQRVINADATPTPPPFAPPGPMPALTTALTTPPEPNEEIEEQDDEKPGKRWEVGGMWNRIADLTTAEWEYHEAYLYRLGPITDRTLTESGKGSKYCTKYTERFDIETIKREWGSGSYRVMLNKTTPGQSKSRPAGKIEFDIEDLRFPPRVPKGEWVDDARNKKWAVYFEQAPTAATAAGSFSHELKEMLQLTLQTAERLGAQKESPVAAAQAAAQAEWNAPGALATLITALKDLTPKPTEGKADAANDYLLRRLDAAEERANKLMERMLEQRAAGTTDPKTAADNLLETVKLMATLREAFGGKAEEEAPAKGFAGFAERWLGPALPAALPFLAPLAGPLAQLISRMAQPPTHTIPTQAMTIERAPAYETLQTPTAPTRASQPTAPVAPAPTADEAAQIEQLTTYATPIGKAMLRHIDRGFDGEDLAQWLIDGYGEDDFMVLKQLGPDALKQYLTLLPEVWPLLAAKEVQLTPMLAEFCAYDPAAATEEETDDDTEEKEATA